MEHDKRVRREIANSNERRRMQSINAGFQSLRSLLPQHEGEKLSKAAILQQTADFICELDSEKSKLESQNSHLKRLLATMPGNSGAVGDSVSAGTTTGSLYTLAHSPAGETPPSVVKRRKTMDGAVESGDEGIGSMSPDHSGSGEESRGELNELRRETMDLRLQLERERRHRVSLEEHIAILQQQQTIYVRKLEQDQLQGMDEVDSGYQAPIQEETVRVVHDKNPRCFTIRNNLETIVEAIRHLEGDHLFSDDRNNSSSSPSSPGDSTPEMEICSSGSSPSSQHSHSPSCSSMELPMVEIQIPASTSPGLVVTEPVTSIKHEILLTRLSHNSSDAEEQPINLEFRPSSRSPSPELILPNIISTSSTLQPLTVQYHQLRPGVIVVKQNS